MGRTSTRAMLEESGSSGGQCRVVGRASAVVLPAFPALAARRAQAASLQMAQAASCPLSLRVPSNPTPHPPAVQVLLSAASATSCLSAPHQCCVGLTQPPATWKTRLPSGRRRNTFSGLYDVIQVSLPAAFLAWKVSSPIHGTSVATRFGTAQIARQRPVYL
jgi:hypothetical protein